MDDRMGDNINGPSLIKVPTWIENPLGRYYLYFAHHDGRYIRLAYADEITGPWRIHAPGVLDITESHFKGHVASPDVHVDDDARQIRMYFHGSDTSSGAGGKQSTRVALSDDGLDFDTQPQLLGNPYWRVFEYDGYHYALGMPGVFYRSRGGIERFEQGPTLFGPDMRHSAAAVRDQQLWIYYTVVGDSPERILLSVIDLTVDWMSWSPSEPIDVLAPEFSWEGVNVPAEPSSRGLVRGPVNQLRDPALFEENGRYYLLYSVAGESGIAIAALE
jgi:hypothetical protein